MSTAVQQFQNFFQVAWNRIVGRAQASATSKTGGIGSTNDPGPGQSGNMGTGAFPIGNISVYPDPKSEAYVKSIYSGNATAYTIIKMSARKFANLPRQVVKVNGAEGQKAAKQYNRFLKSMDSKIRLEKKARKLYTKAYDDNEVKGPLSALLQQPNPMEGQDFFFQKVYTYYDNNGEAVIWLNRGTDINDIPKIDGPVLEMWCLPPQYMEIIPDPYNVWGSLGWIFNVAGKRIPIDNENILHWRTPNPNFDGVTREHMRGLSPWKPGRKRITEDESATDASVSMHQNNGARAIIYDKGITQPTVTQETEIRNVIDAKVNSNDMKGAVAYVQGRDMQLLDLSMSSVDQELEISKDKIFERCCNLLGVPAEIFQTGSTYQNILQARKDLMTNKIIPDACAFNDELMRILLPAFGMNQLSTNISIDATQIIELQDDMLALVQALALAWWLTPNERRAEQNYEPNEDDGSDDMWVPNTLTRMSDAVAPQVDSFDPNSPDYQDPTIDPADKNDENVGGKNKKNSREKVSN